MKLQLEEIPAHEERSFLLMVNPGLNDFFFWHFHPAYELVYVEADQGPRHVGDHLSQYQEGDLVLIGSYIPHLNFDYGVKSACEKIVVHIRADFPDQTLRHTPELYNVQQLFEQSRFGIRFSTSIRKKLSPFIKQLPYQTDFDQFINLLYIFAQLAQDDNLQLLHDRPYVHPYKQREHSRLKVIYQHIDRHYHRKLSVDEMAQICHLSKAAFCRYFKKMTRLTFTQFLNHYRIDQAKRLLLTDKNVTETCFECGFESLSYFNRTFKKITGENPLAFKRRYLDQ